MSTNCGLTEAYSYILFALAEPMHGYGIMQKVQEMSGGTFSLGPGTLYAALKSMQKQHWIEPCGNQSGRRKNYRLTKLGREKANDELERIQRLGLAAANAVKLLDKEQNK
jgi:DNA-binding PadR family transcriptional regulator